MRDSGWHLNTTQCHAALVTNGKRTFRRWLIGPKGSVYEVEILWDLPSEDLNWTWTRDSCWKFTIMWPQTSYLTSISKMRMINILVSSVSKALIKIRRKSVWQVICNQWSTISKLPTLLITITTVPTNPLPSHGIYILTEDLVPTLVTWKKKNADTIKYSMTCHSLMECLLRTSDLILKATRWVSMVSNASYNVQCI